MLVGIQASISPPLPVISAVNGEQAGEWATLPVTELEMSQMQAAGIQMVRFDAEWSCMEPEPPLDGVRRYDWAYTEPCQRRAPDTAVAMLAEDHLRWLPIVDYSTPWASQLHTVTSPPTDVADFATYAGALAARYGARGAFWRENPELPYEPVEIFEIWNEEDDPATWNIGQPNWTRRTMQVQAARYAALYEAAAGAIHRADPGAQVIVGGLGGGSVADWYLADMFKADPHLKGHINGFGLHPYLSTAAQDEAMVGGFRAELNALGEQHVPIDITEIGWPTGSGAQTIQRARWMRQLASVLSHSDCGIGLLAPYAWNDPVSHFALAFPSGLTAAGRGWLKGIGLKPVGPPLCAIDPAMLPSATP
jgi:hypothetical protein